jgi:hypothetical protein
MLLMTTPPPPPCHRFVKADQLALRRLLSSQVIAARGLNPLGHTFVAQQLVTHLPAPPPPPLNSNRGLLAVVAAGPFTTAEDLSYGPLQALLEEHCTGGPMTSVLPTSVINVDMAAVRVGLLLVQ